ncbi:MAG: FAD-dependent monooxygenase [Deltaproteobacteria bacterium]|nr:FAD-dependent monooxygenase [Deltaproteobacteria bacterium]
MIVGGRCAGAPLARFLARAGKRVMLVDAAALPKDQPLSTHFIHPYGMRILEELGLAERIRAIVPPIDTFRIGIGDAMLALRSGRGRAARARAGSTSTRSTTTSCASCSPRRCPPRCACSRLAVDARCRRARPVRRARAVPRGEQGRCAGRAGARVSAAAGPPLIAMLRSLTT